MLLIEIGLFLTGMQEAYEMGPVWAVDEGSNSDSESQLGKEAQRRLLVGEEASRRFQKLQSDVFTTQIRSFSHQISNAGEP